MTLTSGNLDSLVGDTFSSDTLARVNFVSGTAANGAISSITVQNIGAAYPSALSFDIPSVTDANNGVVVNGEFYSGGYYGGSSTVPYPYILVGTTGTTLLFTDAPISAAQVATDIQNGTAASLDGHLYALSLTNADLIATATPITFGALLPPAPTIVSVATAISEQASGQLGSGVTVNDSAADVQSGIDQLQSMAASGAVTSITLTDSGTPTLSITATQLANDAAALDKIAGNFMVVANANAANLTLAGVPNHTTVVSFSGDADQYSEMAVDDGVHFTVTDTGTGLTSTDTLSGVLQLQFADRSISVAQLNSMTEEVALLYQAALGRTPDPGGLAYWTNLADSLPASALADGAYALSDQSTIAAGFTGSAEFMSKYGNLGNTQFVTQLYANTLDRAPDPGGLAYWVGQLASGESREHVLVGFADSTEATNNAVHGFTGQSGVHAPWLLLI